MSLINFFISCIIAVMTASILLYWFNERGKPKGNPRWEEEPLAKPIDDLNLGDSHPCCFCPFDYGSGDCANCPVYEGPFEDAFRFVRFHNPSNSMFLRKWSAQKNPLKIGLRRILRMAGDIVALLSQNLVVALAVEQYTRGG